MYTYIYIYKSRVDPVIKSKVLSIYKFIYPALQLKFYSKRKIPNRKYRFNHVRSICSFRLLLLGISASIDF